MPVRSRPVVVGHHLIDRNVGRRILLTLLRRVVVAPLVFRRNIKSPASQQMVIYRLSGHAEQFKWPLTD